MKRVVLEGILGEKFGEEWILDIKTPAESIRAIEANKNGFCKYLWDSEKEGIAYRIMLDEEDIEPERMLGPFSRETFRIVPVIQGSSSSMGKVILGAIIMVVGIALAAPTGGASLNFSNLGFTIMGAEITAGMITLVGAALITSGIALAMAKQAEVPEESGEHKASYVFAGPVNTVTQGGPVPVGYGRLMVGSILISGGISVDELPIG